MMVDNRCACCGAREGLTSVARLEAGGVERVEWICPLCLRLTELTPQTLTVTRHDMLAVRWKAEHREQPGATYHGQRITGYVEWQARESRSGGPWRAVVALADGDRLELVEGF
ncbi:MAG TPA: hypothetical protein VGF38_17540 [Ktedonobacterales bacterium]|jgi:hypothetical protein